MKPERWALVMVWSLTLLVAFLPALLSLLTGSAFDPFCLSCGGVFFIPLIGERIAKLFPGPQVSEERSAPGSRTSADDA